MIRFGIVGCGNIGRRHAAILSNLEGASLTAICDNNEASLNSVSNNYMRKFSSLDDLIAYNDLDIINICTPHHLHKEMAIKAMRKGLHVLVEKPMALTSADAQEMINCASENDRKLFVVKQNRFNVPVSLVDQLIKDNALGIIYEVHCNVFWNRNIEYYSQSDWRGKKATEGGALYTQASHFIDLLIWWFGELTESKAYLKNYFQPIEFEDSGNAVLKFDTGVSGTLSWTTCVYDKNYEGSITIIAEKGTIKIGGPYLNKVEFWNVKSHPLPEDIIFNDKPNSYGKYQGTSSNHDRVFQEVIKDLEGKPGLVVEGFEGIRSINAIEKIYQSAST
ncbi:MAG: Gfo/Idh/MocA family oxidoreductase [Bacteroidetes bacterium]|nr:Gfo/Idh/MocA family oxidoreductase [Bacteroidota bacterium]MDA1121181.1 Gfo/Idh/MocA family oxidoreductase [Bacteroidota bacterium]